MSRRRIKAITLLISVMIAMLLSYQNCADPRVVRPPDPVAITPSIMPPTTVITVTVTSTTLGGGISEGVQTGSPVYGGQAQSGNGYDFAYSNITYTGKYFVLGGGCTSYFGGSGSNGGGIYVFSKDGARKARRSICYDAKMNKTKDQLLNWGYTSEEADQLMFDMTPKHNGHDNGAGELVVPISDTRFLVTNRGIAAEAALAPFRGILLYEIKEAVDGTLSIVLVNNIPLVIAQSMVFANNVVIFSGVTFQDQNTYRISVYTPDLTRKIMDFPTTGNPANSQCSVETGFLGQVSASPVWKLFYFDANHFVQTTSEITFGAATLAGVMGGPSPSDVCKSYKNKMAYLSLLKKVFLYKDESHTLVPEKTLTLPRQLRSEVGMLNNTRTDYHERGVARAGPYVIAGPFVWKGDSGPVELVIQPPTPEDVGSDEFIYGTDSSGVFGGKNILDVAISEDGHVVLMNHKRIYFFRVQ